MFRVDLSFVVLLTALRSSRVIFPYFSCSRQPCHICGASSRSLEGLPTQNGKSLPMRHASCGEHLGQSATVRQPVIVVIAVGAGEVEVVLDVVIVISVVGILIDVIGIFSIVGILSSCVSFIVIGGL